MAAACTTTATAAADGSSGNTGNLNNDYLDAQIVAQAITELQEIQGPVLHIQGGGNNQTDGVSDLVANIQADAVDGDSTETHVIYYIDSNGSFTGSLEKSYTDSSVQANDYEIERRSGRVPARKRVIPNKFRDYKNTSHDEGSDSDFDPNEYKKVRRVQTTRKKTVRVPRVDSTEDGVKQAAQPSVKVRGVGRPRKNLLPSTTAGGTSISQECFNPPISEEIEKKFQEAIRLSEEEARVEETGKTAETPSDSKQEGDNEKGTEGNQMPVPCLVERRGRGRPRGPFWKKSYKCPDCGKTFNQKANLRVHLLVHTDERPFPCVEEGCGKTFRSNEGLRRHLLSHQGIKPFDCSVCGNHFSSNVALMEHMSRHTDTKPYDCPHCARKFRQVSCLRRHMTTHSNSLPYRCEVCQRQFAQPAYLRSHMKIHTGEKPFKCDVCDKRFAHQSDVKRHRTTHTGEKPYSCGKCQAKFSDVSSKNRHEKEHENNKRFTCHLCSDTFKRMGQLQSHLVRRHSHTFAVKIEKDANNGTFSFKMGEEGDPSSVFVTQKRIISLIKNLQNKGFTEIENIALVSLQDDADSQANGQNLTADISQLEKEVHASEIAGDVGVPVELQGVEVQGADNHHTYITINDFPDSWNEGEKVETDNGSVHYQKVQIITESGEKKEILIPCGSMEPDVNIQVAYADADSEQDNIVTFGTEDNDINDITIDSSSNVVTIPRQDTENVIVEDNAIEGTALIGGETGKVVDYEVCGGNNDGTSNGEPNLPVKDNNAIGTGVLDTVEIDGSIVSLSEVNDVTMTHNDGSLVSQSIAKPNHNPTDNTSLLSKIDEGTNETIKENSYTSTPSEENPNKGDNLHSQDLQPNSAEVWENKPDNRTESPVVTVDYVTSPDFGSQEYYNWLTKFTELCKVLPMPLDMSLFQKISQVHKTVSDVMANPSGVVADRENFTVLMNITKELSAIINEHLVFVLENLRPESKTAEGVGRPAN